MTNLPNVLHASFQPRTVEWIDSVDEWLVVVPDPERAPSFMRCVRVWA